MSDDDVDRSARAELLRLTQSGDLLDLAREMRTMGVESLLFCSTSGRIRQVVTDRQIAYLAATNPALVVPSEREPDAEVALSPVSPGAPVAPAAEDAGIPHQPVRAESTSSASRR